MAGRPEMRRVKSVRADDHASDTTMKAEGQIAQRAAAWRLTLPGGVGHRGRHGRRRGGAGEVGLGHLAVCLVGGGAGGVVDPGVLLIGAGGVGVVCCVPGLDVCVVVGVASELQQSERRRSRQSAGSRCT